MRNYLACKHDENYVGENPVDPTDIDYNLLLDNICTDKRLQQLRMASRIISTSTLELYHCFAYL